jgi:hypothetical protein
VTRTHLADGRIVVWTDVDPHSHAIDAEIADQPVPPALARRTGIRSAERFWPLWTAMEVACKLLDVPAHLWLKQHGLSVAHVAARLDIATFRHHDLTISVGRRSGRGLRDGRPAYQPDGRPGHQQTSRVDGEDRERRGAEPGQHA